MLIDKALAPLAAFVAKQKKEALIALTNHLVERVDRSVQMAVMPFTVDPNISADKFALVALRQVAFVVYLMLCASFGLTCPPGSEIIVKKLIESAIEECKKDDEKPSQEVSSQVSSQKYGHVRTKLVEIFTQSGDVALEREMMRINDSYRDAAYRRQRS